MLDLKNLDLNSLLSNDFVQQYTNFSSVEEFTQNLPVDLSQINLDQLNQFVDGNTQFGNIQELIAKATGGNILDSAKDFLGNLF